MASLGMGNEYYKLSDIVVSMVIPDNKIGNYAFGYMDDEDEVLLEWFWSDDDNDYILEPRSPTAMRPVVSPNNNGGVIQAQTLVYKTQNEQFRQEQIRVQQGQQGGIMMI